MARPRCNTPGHVRGTRQCQDCARESNIRGRRRRGFLDRERSRVSKSILDGLGMDDVRPSPAPTYALHLGGAA